MTVRELYEWAKERDLLDKQIAKHNNFNFEDVEEVAYLPKKVIIIGDRVVVS